MDIYKEGIKKGLRFTTSTKGSLSIEQLFQLTQTDLETAIRNQKKVLKKDNEDDLSFLDKLSSVDKTEQLRFDILKDVYLTKKADAEEARTKLQKKQNNEKIMALIEQKREGALQNKTEEELLAMLQD